MRAITLSVTLGIVWATLQSDYGLPSLVVGCAMGWAVTLVLFGVRGVGSPVLPRLSTRKLWGWMVFVARLFQEITVSTFTVAWLTLHWRMPIKPGIVVVPAEVKGDVEVTVLANSITLTPGTWTLDVASDRDVLYVHALDLPNPDQTIAHIKRRLEQFILRASRC